LIGIEHDATRGVVHKPHRHGHFQFSTASLVHDAAAQPRPEHMEFRFAHRAF